MFTIFFIHIGKLIRTRTLNEIKFSYIAYNIINLYKLSIFRLFKKIGRLN